jgi:hypothetical protein
MELGHFCYVLIFHVTETTWDRSASDVWVRWLAPWRGGWGHLTSGLCLRVLGRKARGWPDAVRCGFPQFVTTVVASEVRRVYHVSDLDTYNCGGPRVLRIISASVKKISGLPRVMNSHYEEISSVGPHGCLILRWFWVMCARVSRFIKVDDISSLMACYKVFEFTSLVACASTMLGFHAGEGSR